MNIANNLLVFANEVVDTRDGKWSINMGPVKASLSINDIRILVDGVASIKSQFESGLMILNIPQKPDSEWDDPIRWDDEKLVFMLNFRQIRWEVTPEEMDACIADASQYIDPVKLAKIEEDLEKKIVIMQKYLKEKDEEFNKSRAAERNTH